MLALLSIEVARGRGFWLCIYHNLDLPTYGTDVGMYVNTTYIRFYSIYVRRYILNPYPGYNHSHQTGHNSWYSRYQRMPSSRAISKILWVSFRHRNRYWIKEFSLYLCSVWIPLFEFFGGGGVDHLFLMCWLNATMMERHAVVATLLIERGLSWCEWTDGGIKPVSNFY